MLSTAVALSTLTTAGVFIIYSKLPKRIRRLIEKHSLLSDLVALVGVYFLLGGTLTALLAASMTGLIVSAMLHIANNKKEFLYLYDLRDIVKRKFKEAKDALNAYGKSYREKQLAANTEQ